VPPAAAKTPVSFRKHDVGSLFRFGTKPAWLAAGHERLWVIEGGAATKKLTPLQQI
jgi:hypothetical protein